MFIHGQENPNKLYQYDKRAKHQHLAENKAVSFCKIGIRIGIAGGMTTGRSIL